MESAKKRKIVVPLRNIKYSIYMKKDNIYRSDDILLLTGKILTYILILPILVTAVNLSSDKTDISTAAALAIMIITPSAFIISGRIIRREEEKILALLRILRENPEVYVQDILNSTDMTRDEIRKKIVLLNSRGFGFFIFEPESDSILNSRLRTRNMVIEKCPGCGSIINRKIPLNLSETLLCPYCNNPIDITYLNDEKKRIIDSIVNREPSHGLIHENQKGINIAVLILLVIFFWPGAIIYIIVRSKKFQNFRF